MDDVDRMYRHLVRTIRATSPQLMSQPFTVADLYTTILPYRLHRRELGLETNQDYEMAMLELLSGGRGYLAVEGRMREALGASLRSPNPDPALIREFSSARVALDPDALQRLEGGPSGAAPQAAAPSAAAVAGASAAPPSRSEPSSRTTAAGSMTAQTSGQTPGQTSGQTSGPTPGQTQAPGREPPLEPFRTSNSLGAIPIQRRSESTTPPSAESSTGARRQSRPITVSPTGDDCPHCSGELPAGRQISFCPHCGQDLTIAHCPACGSELEHEWKFCVTCGRTTGT